MLTSPWSRWWARSPPVDVESQACSLQVRNGSPVPSFYGRTLSRTVPAACTGPPCSEMVKTVAPTKTVVAAWVFTVFSWTIAVTNSAHRRPIKKPKNISNHCCCPISAIILTTSELEAILEICHCSLKPVQKGVRVCVGETLPGTSPPIQWAGTAGSLGLCAWWHPFHLLCQCLFLHLSPFRSK